LRQKHGGVIFARDITSVNTILERKMSEVGKPIKVVTITPKEEPVPVKAPPMPEPVTVPEKVPA
jgi:hypothetical protein